MRVPVECVPDPDVPGCGNVFVSVHIDDRIVRAALDTGVVRTTLIGLPPSARQLGRRETAGVSPPRIRSCSSTQEPRRVPTSRAHGATCSSRGCLPSRSPEPGSRGTRSRSRTCPTVPASPTPWSGSRPSRRLAGPSTSPPAGGPSNADRSSAACAPAVEASVGCPDASAPLLDDTVTACRELHSCPPTGWWHSRTRSTPAGLSESRRQTQRNGG